MIFKFLVNNQESLSIDLSIYIRNLKEDKNHNVAT